MHALIRKINEYFDETMKMFDELDNGRNSSIVVSVPHNIVKKIRETSYTS